MHRYVRTAGGEYCKALYIVTAICVTMHMSRIYNVSSLINQPLLSVHRETVYEKAIWFTRLTKYQQAIPIIICWLDNIL